MRVTFYAPMKPPDHPTPSGDWRIARLLMSALRLAGHEVETASRLRSWEGAGDAARQARVQRLGERMAQRLIRRYLGRPASKRPDAWLTYNLYHKAPDWLGPAVADALSIPYIVAGASVAPKQAGGPWSSGHEATIAAVKRADAVIRINSDDEECVKPLLNGGGHLAPLAPFIDTAPFVAAAGRRGTHRADLTRRFSLDEDIPWLLTVAMMRDGDKLASYRILAEALAGLAAEPWSLLVVGDGPARPAVEAALATASLGAGADRVFYAGQHPPDALPALYAACDLCLWPGVNEALGMTYLEAHAAGLPVVAGGSRGVRDIVGDGETGLLPPTGDGGAFRRAVAELLADPPRRRRMGEAALAKATTYHDIAGAARVLDQVLHQALRNHRP
jgi:glycosyltransferase involved in cell wall biosynthesis